MLKGGGGADAPCGCRDMIRVTSFREFKDVVFEDVVFDNNSFVTLSSIVL